MLLVASGIPFGLSRDPVGCMAPPRLRVRRDGQLPHRHRHQSWSFLIKSIQTGCWFESTSRIHPSTSEIYTVRSYLSCLSTLPCKWVSIIESQHASSDSLPHHSMLDHLDLLLSWAQQWEPDPFSILVVLKSIRSSRRQYLLNFQTCKKTQPTFTRHLIAPPLQELCLGIIAKHLCIDCLQGWRATIHDLGTKDQTRSGSLLLMKTFDNFWPQPPPRSTSHLWEECRSWEMQQARRLQSSSSLTVRYYPPMKKKASGLNNRAWYVKNCAASLFRLACAKSSQNQNHGKKMVIEIWC